jgi:hypothetical protein
MASREDKIKDWYEDAVDVHPSGAVGFAFLHKITGTPYRLEESHYYDVGSGVWS